MAGILLIIMGLAKLGDLIKFIPHPLIIGFTSGIALIIFSSQIKDFFGLKMNAVPSDFLAKWQSYIVNISSFNTYAFLTAFITVLIIIFWPKITYKVPGSLIAILVTTAAAHLLHLPVETIGSRFGSIPSSLPMPSIPDFDYATIKNLIQPAVTIALLGGIESLLSAVVADGMIGGNHKSNTELIGQGTANILSALFGGIPATGAIARTATNVKNGGRTPIAGIVHAITLLLIMLFIGRWAVLIPMPTLAGILVVIAYNMSEWESFLSVTRGPRGDIAVLVITFLLTVFVDLTVAIEIGMILAAFLFLRKMISISGVHVYTNKSNHDSGAPYHSVDDPRPEDQRFINDLGNFIIPNGTDVFEITGPFFFGAVHKFKDAMKAIDKAPAVVIIRMRQVPIIDATGIKTLEEVHKEFRRRGTLLILSGVTSVQVKRELVDTGLLVVIGEENITTNFAEALQRAATHSMIINH
jgi:SulP family sulfate permease